jgi:uracil-DNA glycosylase
MFCTKCERLCRFIEENKKKYPSFFNAPVPAFGDDDPVLMIIGLAPGLKGANQTGRPFTKDYAGHLLYDTLLRYGWATGLYEESVNDSLRLVKSRITNAVKCVPPENKVTTREIINCNEYLKKELSACPHLKVVLSLGTVSHDAVCKAFGLKKSAYPFRHNGFHRLPNGVFLLDSYHCSKYNTSTKKLTPEMFRQVFDTIKTLTNDEERRQ